MNYLNALIWLFPVLFMFNDFEEAIMVNPWKKKNKEYILSMRKKNKHIPYDSFNGDTESVTTAIFVQFITVVIVTIYTQISGNYIVGFGFFMGFYIHLFIHIWINIRFGRYVPGTISSIGLIPVCTYMLYKCNVFALFSVGSMVIAVVLAGIEIVVQLHLVHKGIKEFEVWIQGYRMES